MEYKYLNFMTQETLRVEYNRYNNETQFNLIKEEIESKIVRSENYKGIFYNIEPFEYQRAGMKQGRPVKNLNLLKTTNNLYTYGFDANDNIVEVRKGISIEKQFYYQFLYYSEGLIKSLFYNNGKILQNISYYILDENGLLKKILLSGRFGSREETYFYENENQLTKIETRQFGLDNEEKATLFDLFEYNDDGSLKTITKTTLRNKNYREIIYPKKR